MRPSPRERFTWFNAWDEIVAGIMPPPFQEHVEVDLDASPVTGSKMKGRCSYRDESTKSAAGGDETRKEDQL